jgi:hypothetical protein
MKLETTSEFAARLNMVPASESVIAAVESDPVEMPSPGRSSPVRGSDCPLWLVTVAVPETETESQDGMQSEICCVAFTTVQYSVEEDSVELEETVDEGGELAFDTVVVVEGLPGVDPGVDPGVTMTDVRSSITLHDRFPCPGARSPRVHGPTSVVNPCTRLMGAKTTVKLAPELNGILTPFEHSSVPLSHGSNWTPMET